MCDLCVGIWELGDLTVCVHELGVPMWGQGLGDYGESFFLSMKPNTKCTLLTLKGFVNNKG